MPSQFVFPVTNTNPSKEIKINSDPASQIFLKPKINDDPVAETRVIVSSLVDDDESSISTEPLLPRSFSFNSSSSPNSHQKRRRRIGSESSLSSFSDPGSSGRRGDESLSEEVAHVASETFVVTRLSLKLLGYLGVGYRWVMRFLALGCYSLMLLPGFVQGAAKHSV